MSTTQTFLKDASTRHAIFLERFSGGQLNRLVPFLEEILDKAVLKLTRTDITKANKIRTQGLITQLRADIGVVHGALREHIQDSIKEFAEKETDFNLRMFNKSTNLVEFVPPSSAQVTAAVFGTPITTIDESISIDKALEAFSKKKVQDIIKTVKTGIVSGNTSQEIAMELTTLTTLHKRQVGTLVRTITNHVSTATRVAITEANEDIIKGYQWVATLDSGTTETCASLDGRIFPKTSNTKPPIHWGCRSTIIPVVRKKYNQVEPGTIERPAVGADGVEAVDARTTYNSWLKRQPKRFQEEVLGKTKAKLFREGGLSMRSFVDKNFKPLTLDELMKTEPLAFERAGIIE